VSNSWTVSSKTWTKILVWDKGWSLRVHGIISVKGQLILLEIIFQNEFFVAVNKPAMVLSVPSRQGARDTRPVLGIMLQEHFKKQVFPVHRLDECVSGIIMFALSSHAHRAANGWFEQHQIQKTYEALAPALGVQDDVQEGRWVTWSSLLVKGKKRAFEAAYGKSSKTSAICWQKHVASGKQAHSVWRLMPLTGRSHQLRFEMAKHGLPIVGDELYGSKLTYDSGGIALRAIELDLSKVPNRHDFDLPEFLKLSPLFK
jgi:tRNA pseudouridine32 synthase / 23S rRNA pseudouridine746 synthase